ncbi:Methyltransferase domain containing protein [Parasponia andersonii]|uniref:Methyltransferase domain containing protein n=1 Tax=Parasponia andersonii TaxID=3476 RepID=A0A2P5D1V8_PARAD|nr:Methyltransferase domain containing protein [Parasponia andersonii]
MEMTANGATDCRYSCETAAQTLQWIHAIVDFLKPYSFLTNAHVVNFFKDRLWEAIDKEWIECLRNEPVENLLQIPSGVVQDHWPASLKKFILTLRSLVFPREQADLRTVLPSLNISSLSTVLAQGMNPKKKHEVEVLSAVVSYITNSVKAHTIVDVGAGQGYLAQVLSFHYQHSVVAIDASSHHGRVTDARAERIKKHYASQMRKSGPGKRSLIVPKTITCHVMSIDTLKDLTSITRFNDNEHDHDNVDTELQQPSCHGDNKTSVVLAGLHACGDLSVMMLKTFLDCEEVKAVVSVGCCYNLLSEVGFDNVDPQYGFPMSRGVKYAGLSLGKSLRDLACQSAERWRCLEIDDGVHNFELHAFRAAFQMVLNEYYPEVMTRSLSIGRQGKALRRLQKRGTFDSRLIHKDNACASLHHIRLKTEGKTEPEADDGISSLFEKASLSGRVSHSGSECDDIKSVDKYSLFLRYTQSGLYHLGLEPLQDIDFPRIWKEVEPFSKFIGLYWSLRAALGPLLETFLLLDRLLFLQEQGNTIEAVMLSIFDPALSPRNVAIIAKKN